MRHESHRQIGLVEDFVAGQRGEGHLGGRDGPQVVTFEVVGVVDELGQMTRRDHRGGSHHRRRTDLLVEVGVTIERQLTQRSCEGGAGPAVHHEHRAGHLHAPLDIEDAVVLADLPVGCPLMGAVRLRIELFHPADHVVGLACAVGAVVGRQVRNAQEQLTELLGGLVGLPIEVLLLFTERPTLLLQAGRLVAETVTEELTDLVGDGADARAELIAGDVDSAHLGIESDHGIDHGEVLAPASQTGGQRFEIVPEQTDVEHAQNGSGIANHHPPYRDGRQPTRDDVPPFAPPSRPD